MCVLTKCDWIEHIDLPAKLVDYFLIKATSINTRDTGRIDTGQTYSEFTQRMSALCSKKGWMRASVGHETLPGENENSWSTWEQVAYTICCLRPRGSPSRWVLLQILQNEGITFRSATLHVPACRPCLQRHAAWRWRHASPSVCFLINPITFAEQPQFKSSHYILLKYIQTLADIIDRWKPSLERHARWCMKMSNGV